MTNDDAPISALGLSSLALGRLRRAGVKSAGELRAMTESRLLTIPGLGRGILGEIRNAVVRDGGHLGGRSAKQEDSIRQIIDDIETVRAQTLAALDGLWARVASMQRRLQEYGRL